MSRVVLITGASGGIGAAVAAAFARAGDTVALGAHQNLAKAGALASQLCAEGHTAAAFAADVASEGAVEALFCAVEKRLGAVEVLVNCAGFAQQKMLCDITLPEWQRMFAVHVTGSFLCAKRALPAMVRKKAGCIVNLSSMWGQVGASCEVHYSAAKAAVIGFTKALAKEVGPAGVRVNCVAPGAIDTAMMADFTTEDIAALCAQTPLARLGTPGEVADAVVFLASQRAGYITGQVLSPNGGLVI